MVVSAGHLDTQEKQPHPKRLCRQEGEEEPGLFLVPASNPTSATVGQSQTDPVRANTEVKMLGTS